MSDSSKIFRTEQQGSVLIVIPSGDHIGFHVGEVQSHAARVVEQFETSEAKDVIFDASQSEYISSSVIGAMIQLWEAALNAGGRFFICNVSDDAMAAIVATRLDTKWPSYDTREDALKAMQ